jgi:xanthine dehydrogenase accessory factor
MNNHEAIVIKSALQWLKDEKEFWLCTIISARGASVRSLGSLFLYDGENKKGFISEPRSDDAFCKLLNNSYFKDEVSYFTYGNQLINDDESLIIPCCGNVTLMIEKVKPSKKSFELFTQWNNLIEQRESFRRTFDKTINSTIFEKYSLAPSYEDKNVKIEDDKIEIVYIPIIQVLLIGATPVSKQIARLSRELGFMVKLCENRKLFLDNLKYEGKNTNFELCELSSNEFVQKYVDRYSAILSLAHDPNIDDNAVSNALTSDSFYIGAIGSQKNCDKRVLRLKEKGFSDTLISKLYAPIGLGIKSKTPDEIAISIIAQMISLKPTI